MRHVMFTRPVPWILCFMADQNLIRDVISLPASHDTGIRRVQHVSVLDFQGH